MMDREQQLIDAAMRYHALLDRGQAVNVREFVAAEPADLRDELAEYLELLLITDAPDQSIALTAEEQALSDRVAERTRAKLHQQMSAAARSLTDLRKARQLSLGQLARQINLPVDLLQRIERGGVLAATIPGKLIDRIAQVLQQAEGDEQAVPFADALQASSATDDQKAEWA
jgi:DNA-binding transcriptional regulator YiaG